MVVASKKPFASHKNCSSNLQPKRGRIKAVSLPSTMTTYLDNRSIAIRCYSKIVYTLAGDILYEA